jgi:group II intron reverse transcriptase/maturase
MKREKIAELAKQIPDQALTTLSHHIDLEWLREAHRRTRKNAAPGVDGQRAEQYAERLDENLEDLLNRAKSGLYRAPPVKRVEIPKGKSGSRPIGIPTHEDKVLQRAVVMALEPVYEETFHDFSYGFRPGRSAHDALDALWKGIMRLSGGWVLEVDIQSFFDTLDHQMCRELLRQRVQDGVLVRLVGKWLRAKVLEGGVVRRTKRGTPQGGVISPLLANIYLHHVLDDWWVEEVQPRLKGRAFLIRYADDFVTVFEHEEDARRVQQVLPKRFAKHGLTLHPDKTRLLPFRPTPRKGEPRSFDFLGFTHYWGKSRKGRPAVKRKTAKDRFSRSVRAIGAWCKKVRWVRLADQAKHLRRKLQGHYAYYGITGNAEALQCFYEIVKRLWHKWLSRRSQRAYIPWERFEDILRRHPLPRPRVVHSIYVAKP